MPSSRSRRRFPDGHHAIENVEAMTQLMALQKTFRPFKSYLPGWVSKPIRGVCTAMITPILFSWKSGHFRSCFQMRSVSKNGDPIPWYTYPSVAFLNYRSYADKTVLEFGGGQSTLWWARKAKQVVTFEGKESWYRHVEAHRPENVDLHFVPTDTAAQCLAAVSETLTSRYDGARFDVVVIDGLCRHAIVPLAVDLVADAGIIVCDNSEAYGYAKAFRKRDFSRVDFFGHTAGVAVPHCTSVFFRPGSFVFEPSHPIPDIAAEN